MKDLKRKGGSKKSKISGIPTLDDANNAGGRNSKESTPDSHRGRLRQDSRDLEALRCGPRQLRRVPAQGEATQRARRRLSVVGRDNYGVFPLRGKQLNVRDAGHAQIM